jgi:hypothetical protein
VQQGDGDAAAGSFGAEGFAGVVVAERVRGSQVPRIELVPEGVEHPRWDEIREFVDALGVTLDEWQWRVLHGAFLRNGDVWAAFAVAVCAPRQNGKNGILEVRELVGALLLGEKLQIHSAHLADTSKEGFRRLDDLIDANGWLSRQVKHIWRTNGHESIEFRNGNRIRFRTRTRGGGRGFSGAPAFFDEAMFLPEVSMGSILPVISAQPDPQVWYMGSAVDQLIHEDGVVFARVRERALKGEDPRLAYFEWSIDAESPDEVEPEQASDVEMWARSNPALGIRIMPDYVQAEHGELDDRTFAVERLGVGDWPQTTGSSTVVDLMLWDGLADASSKIASPVVFAFDVSPSRAAATISASGVREDGLAHVETVEQGRGTGWIVPRLVELVGKHEAAKVICDAVGPAAALIPELEKNEITVETVTAQDYGRACGGFFDAVERRTVKHLGTPEIRSAIKGAATRPLGDAWAWSRKNSGVDITPLVAATLALWGAVTAKPQSSGWGPAEAVYS